MIAPSTGASAAPGALAFDGERAASDAGAVPLSAPVPGRRALTVLVAAPTLAIGAADEGALDLVRILTAAGHRCIVVSQGGRLESELARLDAGFVKLDAASQNPFVIARNVFALRRIIRARACDVVHAHGRASAWSARLAARLCGLPFLTSCYAGFREQNIFKHWYNSALAQGDHVFAASESIARQLVERHGVAPDRVCVVGVAVDFAPFDPGLVTAERIAAARDAWGVTPATRVVLVPGRIIRRKGHEAVVQAAARLKAKGVKDVVFVFAGEDEGRSRYSGELWDLVLATKTADVIRIMPALADRAACYAAAAMVVAPAIQLEGPERAVLEAMAMERPVIASELAAGPEAMLSPPIVGEESMTGLSVPAGDDEALAAALIRMVSYPPTERQAMGRRARALALSRFDRAGVAERTLSVYARVARVPEPADAPPAAAAAT